MNDLNWDLWVVFHRDLFPEYYQLDKTHLKLVKAEGYSKIPFDAEKYREMGYTILEENRLSFYNKTLQPAKFHAPSVLYHFYKNKVHEGRDYIGFMEYDLVLNKKDVEKICSSIGKVDVIHLSSRHYFKNLAKQRDVKVDGKYGMIDAVDKYNEFFKTDHKFGKLLEDNPLMCTQQSFICKSEVFDKLGQFLEFLIERPLPKYTPMPATLFERYISVFLEFEKSKLKMKLEHKMVGYLSRYTYK